MPIAIAMSVKIDTCLSFPREVAGCREQRGAGPEHRSDPERGGESARGHGYADVREVVDREPEPRYFARTAGWRVVVGEVERERLAHAQRKPDAEREREKS